jgi:hypothetical protein
MDEKMYNWDWKHPLTTFPNPIVLTEDPNKLPDTVEISEPWNMREVVGKPPCPKPPKQKQMFHKANYNKLQKFIDPESYYYRTNKRLATDIYNYGGAIIYSYFNHSSIWDVSADFAVDVNDLLQDTGEIPLLDLDYMYFYYPNEWFMLPLPRVYTPDHTMYFETPKLEDQSGKIIETFSDTPKQKHTLLWIIIIVLFIYMIIPS